MKKKIKQKATDIDVLVKYVRETMKMTKEATVLIDKLCREKIPLETARAYNVLLKQSVQMNDLRLTCATISRKRLNRIQFLRRQVLRVLASKPVGPSQQDIKAALTLC
jgi:hypothetical protein